jgi:hypothetical protein
MVEEVGKPRVVGADPLFDLLAACVPMKGCLVCCKSEASRTREESKGSRMCVLQLTFMVRPVNSPYQ